ncbi:MAG: EamA family transporter, partial [Thermodesulfobacteriota bacterium]
MSNLRSEKFPIKGYLFLISTAFFTALSYAFGKSLDNSLDPETTTFFWFFGAFIFALILVPFLPSQQRELKQIWKYKKIFIWSSILTSVGAALWVMSLWTIGPALTSFLMKSQTLFSLLLGVFFLGERLN